MLIDASLLERIGACEEQRDLFNSVFTDGLHIDGDPDPTAIDKIAEAKLDVEWFATVVLVEDAHRRFNIEQHRAESVYNIDRAPSLDEYTKTMRAAWNDYRAKSTSAAYLKYTRAASAAFDKYEKDRAPSWFQYTRARAEILWRMLQVPTNHLLET